MTVNMLIQIDKLVQLLESPVFTCRSSYSSDSCTIPDRTEQISVSSYWSLRNTHTYTSAFTVF